MLTMNQRRAGKAYAAFLKLEMALHLGRTVQAGACTVIPAPWCVYVPSWLRRYRQ
jgi:hypothetical protein